MTTQPDQDKTIENKVLLDVLKSLAGITHNRTHATAFQNAINRINDLERQLAEAQKDQARLDFMAEHRIYVSWARDRECCTLWVPEDIDDVERPFEGYPHKNYDAPRQAIDAAIAQQGKS